MGEPGFESREDSILENLLGFFGLSEVNRKERYRIIISTNTLQEQNLFDCDLSGKNEACSCGQRRLCMSR